MNAIHFGDPNLFVKGMVEAVLNDPLTGNIVGYDNVTTDDSLDVSQNLGAIEGGFHNALIMNIPDSARVSGSLTSQAFSLEARGHMFGKDATYGAVTPTCETITASGTSLTVSKTPVKAYGQNDSDTYGWCFVRPSGASDWNGTNYNVDLSTGVIQDFTATSGNSYDVQYFISNASAKVLPIPVAMIPRVLSLTLKFGVYLRSNDGSVAEGTLAGYLYEVFPRVQLTGNGGHTANQTDTAKTEYQWQALAPNGASAMPNCAFCADSAGNYGYYIWCPCDSTVQNVSYWLFAGGNSTSAAAGAKVTVPFLYVMKDGTFVNAPWSDFTVNTPSGCTYSNGVLTVDAGTIGTAWVQFVNKYGVSYNGRNTAAEQYNITVTA